VLDPSSPFARSSQTELQALHRVAKASSERVDTVKRAKALLAVAGGESFTQAGKLSGLSREGVSQLVERFNQRGLASLVIASGRGRKPTYAAEARAEARANGAAAAGSPTGPNGHLVAQAVAAGRTSSGVTFHWSHHYWTDFARGRVQPATRPHLVSNGNRLSLAQKRGLSRAGSTGAGKKRLIELAYSIAEACGLPLW
jgi:Helix-turn-helix domain